MKTNTIPSAPSIQTFALDLGDGIRCTAKIDIHPDTARPGELLLKMTQFWEGRPRKAHWPQYFAWIKTVWQSLANATQKKLLYVFKPPTGDPLAVQFNPNQPSVTIPLPRR
ncbi:MAG: hypothetical protein WCJ07_08370 [Verrucomicrobiota bacterium]